MHACVSVCMEGVGALCGELVQGGEGQRQDLALGETESVLSPSMCTVPSLDTCSAPKRALGGGSGWRRSWGGSGAG